MFIVIVIVLTVPVDVAGDDTASLHEHVVTGRRHGPGPHGVGVARVPADLDGMG